MPKVLATTLKHYLNIFSDKEIFLSSYLGYIITRVIIVGVRGRCSVHLTNDGVTVENRRVRVDWGLSADQSVEPEEVVIMCMRNDALQYSSCKF